MNSRNVDPKYLLGVAGLVAVLFMSAILIQPVPQAMAAKKSSDEPSADGAPTPPRGEVDTSPVSAPLALVDAKPSNPERGQFSWYDIYLVTGSACADLKFVDIAFDFGTDLSRVRFIEARGFTGPTTDIGTGTLSTVGTTLTYTRPGTAPGLPDIPAGRLIQILLADIGNSNSFSDYLVTVTTRNAAGAVCDGPTSNSLPLYSVVQPLGLASSSVFGFNIVDGTIGGIDVADGSLTGADMATPFLSKHILSDSAAGNARGWTPDGFDDFFSITDGGVSPTTSMVMIAFTGNVVVDCVQQFLFVGGFNIACDNSDWSNPNNGAVLHYMIINDAPVESIGPVSESSSPDQPTE